MPKWMVGRREQILRRLKPGKEHILEDTEVGYHPDDPYLIIRWTPWRGELRASRLRPPHRNN